MGDLFKATLMDVHDELRESWIRALERGEADEFGAPVVTEEEADGLSRGWKRNPRMNDHIEAWLGRAREALRCR